LQPLLGRLLQIISESARRRSGAAATEAMRRELEDLFRSLSTRTRGDALADAADQIIVLVEQLLEATESDIGEQELSAALGLVRDAVSLIAAEERGLQQTLTASTTRLRGIVHLPELAALRDAVLQEAAHLSDVAARRDADARRHIGNLQAKIETLEEHLAATRVEATYDGLTGLLNRRSVESAYKQFSAMGRRFVLALFDVDDFKRINDILGHLGGDAALKSIGKTLQTFVRSQDIVGRFGGDEFILLMVDTTLGQAEHRLLSLLQTIRTRPLKVDGFDRMLTVSCGAAEFQFGDRFEDLLQRADRALYSVKRTGKNRLAVTAAAAGR
jgi:diguanylate cyclase